MKNGCSNRPWKHTCPEVDGLPTCKLAAAWYKKQEEDEAEADSLASRRYEEMAYGFGE